MARSKILVVDDERMIRWSIQQALAKDGYAVASVETGEEAVAQASDEMPDLVFLDITLPGIDGIEVLRRLKAADPSVSVVMVTATEDVKTAVEAMRLGAYDYISKPFDLDRLRVIAKNALDRHELKEEVEFLRKETVNRYGFHRFIGDSEKIRHVVDIARKVARSDATTVLIQGESGTGKDLLAQGIHSESGRSSRPFIPINCTALPGELLESELMGHEKGAFTDAKAMKKGLFEVSDGGTVFLDEIGDMKADLQSKLLRFIEGKSFRRVGGHRDIFVDVRIIAATNRNLTQLVKEGAFREDLFFRLDVFPIFIPPLRERREDILPLANHFLEAFSRDFRRKCPGFSRNTILWMNRYDWPGNVRELRNLIERALILGDEGEVELDGIFEHPWGGRDGGPDRLESLPGSGIPPGPVPERSPGGEQGSAPQDGDAAAIPASRKIPLPEGGVDLEEVEKSFIQQSMARHGGNQTKAARYLGLTRDALRYRMKKYGFLD